MTADRTMSKEELLTRITMHQIAHLMAQRVTSAIIDAAEALAERLNEGKSEELDPGTSRMLRAFLRDEKAFRQRTGLDKADPNNADPAPVLRALGFTLDWLEQLPPAVEAELQRHIQAEAERAPHGRPTDTRTHLRLVEKQLRHMEPEEEEPES